MAQAQEMSMDLEDYNGYIESMRRQEYPMLKDTTYLDHAGTTLYSKSLMDGFHHDMMANLYGNPHSASPSSQRSTQEIENVRLELLHFFKADPDHFDLIFTANATAAFKLVGDAFREQDRGFWYGYHVDSHTSLVGLRQLASSHRCFASDEEVERWIDGLDLGPADSLSGLFAYPAQSNMNGRRLPLEWCKRMSKPSQDLSRRYILLDAAALVSTSPLDLSDPTSAPDFTAISLYKIFGFPDLGALVVKKDAAHVFEWRRYFGGGTVDMVTCVKEKWHARKTGPLHERLEDGTLPTHNIIALKSALSTHQSIFGSLEKISQHTSKLAQELVENLLSLQHGNGQPVCTVYGHPTSHHLNSRSQGPVIALNLKDCKGAWVSNAEVEKLACVENIHLRTGGVCNPGGVAQALDLRPWEIQKNFSAGHRCGSENDIMHGKPTGVIRLSIGAMSTMSDVKRFLAFTRDYFMDDTMRPSPPLLQEDTSRFYIESLTIYPIKSCGGYQVPFDQAWEVRSHGLAWDREWCVLHRGSGKALSQKQYPRMALVRPVLDLHNGVLRVSSVGDTEEVLVPLSKDPAVFGTASRCRASVCGDAVDALVYALPKINAFLSRVIGVSCCLARHNPAASFSRHCKAHLQPNRKTHGIGPSIYMANESPILTISRSSLNHLNEQIKAKGGKAAHPGVFRANVVLAENPSLSPGYEQPWVEDAWTSMCIGGADGPVFEFLGGCRRCQMVCVDQHSAEKNPEPLVTLAKTRRFEGRVLFGVHTSLREEPGRSRSIRVGDTVETFGRDGG